MSSASETPPTRAATRVLGVMSNYRWTICGLLFVATTILYIDRQILALLKETLEKKFGWTNEDYGDIQAYFQGAYALAFPLFGWFIDRFGVKIGYAVSIAGWGVAACGHGLISTLTGFKIGRLGVGLSESGNFPSAIKAAAQWFPKRERALATSIFNSGANVGPVIAPLTIPLIAAAWGWRSPFILAGLVGFVWVAVWWFVYDVPEKHRRVSAAELAYIRSDADDVVNAPKIPWRSLMGYRQTWSFIVAKALTDPIWWFFLFWLPDYFNKARHLDIKHSQVHLATIYVICTVLSISGGWLTGWLQRMGWSVTRARKTGMLIFALCVTPIISLSIVKNDWIAVLLIGLAVAAHQAWSATLFTTVSDMFPKRAVASVVGIGGMAGSLTGIYFPKFTGMLLDKVPGQAYGILFGVCACAYLVAFGLHHALAPRFDPVKLDKIEAA